MAAGRVGNDTPMKIGELLLALFLPGIAVGLRCGFLSRQSGIAWLLTLLGHVPGVVYAMTVITAS